MRLEIAGLRSPDLDLEDGVPNDLAHFEVFVEVTLREPGRPGSGVFHLPVASPSAVAQWPSGRFVAHTLLPDRFSWAAVQACVDNVLLHARGASSWDDVIRRFAGLVQHADAA